MSSNYIVPILRQNSGCDFHRIILPFEYFGIDTTAQAKFDVAGLVVFNRIPNCNNDRFFIQQRRIGFKYIIDLDDYWILDKSHYLYRQYEGCNYAKRVEELIKRADYVTVTTSLLASEAMKINRNVEVIPNALPFDCDQFVPGQRPISREVKFVYAGGASHFSDMKIVQGIMDDYGFRLAGYNKAHPESLKIASLFPKSELYNGLPLSSYMDCYEGCDVSMAPLDSTKFNSLKSNLKVLEAGCKGIPIICSKVLPYYNEVDAKYVDYASSKAEWESKVKYFADNPSYGLERGIALAEHVRECYQLSKANEIRKQLYKHVLG